MRVLNKHKDAIPEDSIYIGRGSMWGNPFVIGKDGNREEVIEKYREHLYFCLQVGEVTIDDLLSLEGHDLVCFCTPKPCHGDILKRAVNWACYKRDKDES